MPYGGKLKDVGSGEAGSLGQSRRGVAANTAAAATASKDGKYVISPERRNFWSFLPLTEPAGTRGQGYKLAEDRISTGSFSRGSRRKA